MKSATYLLVLACVHLNFTPIFQLQIPPSVMSRDRAKGCLTMQERDSARQAIREFSIALQRKTECGEGYWSRVAYLNMSDPMQSCPPAWRDRSANGIRVCGLPAGLANQCGPNIYSTRGQTYTKVCGRVIGYQFGHTDGFRTNQTIDVPYVDGVSITHGSPRSHIWSLAADRDEPFKDCPCEAGGESAPPFVGDNYYCESGYNDTKYPRRELYTSDPLWDGAGCESEGSCCSTAPWFTVDLINSTADDIEVRICSNYYESEEDTPIHLLELYIQ